MTVGHLLLERPAATTGTPIGVDDWRFAVEAVLPTEADALWGEAIWDTDLWSELVWTDLTADVRGLEWGRGADDPAGRPRVGTATITLDNLTGEWCPWGHDAAYFGPGTLFRFVAHEPTKHWWVPQFAGVVESWLDTTDELGVEWTVTITLAETVDRLAHINNNALSAVEGSGDTAATRIVRLLAAANWPFGFHAETSPTFALQATDMALNRVTECYLTADSTDTNFYSHRSGLAFLAAVDARDNPDYQTLIESRWGTATWDVSLWSTSLDDLWPTARIASLFYGGIELHPTTAGPGRTITTDGRGPIRIVYDADSLIPANDADMVVNDVRLARAGGTEVIRQDFASMGRHGQRTFSRNDLVCSADSTVLSITEAILDRRAWNVLRVTGASFHGRMDQPEPNMPALMIVDIGDRAFVVLPAGIADPMHDMKPAVAARIAGYTHSIISLTASELNWRTAMTVDTIGPAVTALVADDPDGRITTPNHASLSITGDMSWIIRGSIRRLITPGTFARIVDHPSNFELLWWHDHPTLGDGFMNRFHGTTTQERFLGLGDFPVLDFLAENDIAVGMTYRQNVAGNYNVKVWQSVDGDDWTLLFDLGGTGTSTRAAGTDSLALRAYRAAADEVPADGAIAHFSLYNGLGAGNAPGGTLVASYDAHLDETSHTDPTGKVWTVEGTEYGWHYLPGDTPSPA